MTRRYVTDEFSVPWEEFAPRDDPNRFRIYCRSNDGDLTLVANERGHQLGVGFSTVRHHLLKERGDTKT